MAKFEEVKEGVIFPLGEEIGDLAQYFSGEGYLERLVSDPEIDVGVSNVTFAPGTYNNWHIHRSGYQILLVTGGEGWYQKEGEAPELLRAGDTVVVHEDVKHWHGATKDSWFVHLSISAGEIEWLEPVDEEFFLSIHKN